MNNNNYVDTAAITQVIGCLFNNPTLFDTCIIQEADFPEQFHKILVGTMYNLHKSGSQITLDAIIDYLANRPKLEAIFKQNKGIEYISEVSKRATQKTFNYYYNRVKKFTVLRLYNEKGVDVTDIYDPNNIIDTKKREKQEDWLDNASVQDIVSTIDKRIDEVKYSCLSSELGIGWQAGDGIDDLLIRLKRAPEIGIPLYGSLINTITRGARLRKYYLRSAPTGIGKAIPNDTIIPTPNGKRMVGDIKPGDFIFGDDGKPVKVLRIYPQKTKKRIYEVIFSDNRIAKCCEDHLWEYSYDSHRGYSSRVESTKDILERVSKLKNNFKDASNKGFRFRVKLNGPVQYEKKNLPIDPYVLGLMLGDGSFRYRDSNKELTFSSKTDELPNVIGEIMGWKVKKNSERNYNYSFYSLVDGHKIWVEEFLEQFPDLMNQYSQGKFIPSIYLESNIEQRYALLQGLLDTDGSIDQTKGRITFTNTSLSLINQVVDLCHGLGFITSIAEDKREEKYTESCYTVHIQCKKELKPKLFRLSSNVARAITYAASKKRSEHKEYIAIKDIRATETFADMTCFTVDNSSHLFLTNDYIVTHNSRTMVADVCNFACDEIYHDQFGWIKNGHSQPTLYIGTEQEKDEIQTMMLAFLSNVDEEHIICNYKYLDGEEERVRHAAEIIKRSPLWCEWLPDFSLKDVENVIVKHIREHDVAYVAFDYIKTSPKILEEISRRSGGIRLREDNVLFMLSSRLKDIANEYGIFIMSATQLNESWKNDDIPDQNLLRGAKSIADTADIGMILLRTTQEDLTKLEPILEANPSFISPTHKISIYKNRGGSYAGCYLWCTASLGTCRIEPEFCTTWRHTLLGIEDLKIIIEDKPAAWEKNN